MGAIWSEKEKAESLMLTLLTTFVLILLLHETHTWDPTY